MAHHWIELIAPDDYTNKILNKVEEFGAKEVVAYPATSWGGAHLKLLVDGQDRQQVVDKLQSHLTGCEDWRIVMTPTSAVIPDFSTQEPTPEEKEAKKRKRAVATREEIHQQISASARTDTNFLLLTGLSVIVATIGMAQDNVAVVVGAMVIAPLLGPNIALAFSIAIGDNKLLGQALATNLLGLLFTLAISLMLPHLVQMDYGSAEMLSRTKIGFDGVALALLSGVAAALSVTTNLSSTLVGVMVAVALMPPAVVLGISLSLQNFENAMGAATLLATNIVCVNLASNAVFLMRDISPRAWHEKRSARKGVMASLTFWTVMLAVLAVVIWLVDRQN